MWNGSSWRRLTSAWVWNGSQWRPINSGWAWNGSAWRQIFSSGDFTVNITDNDGNIISNRNVGVSMVGQITSNVSGTYSYSWQFSSGNNWGNTWTTRTSGTLTGSNVSTSYTTTTTDVSILENYANNYKHYFRLNVTRGVENQISNSVRVHKRLPVKALNVAQGRREYSNFLTTYNALTRAPYILDTVTFWSPSAWSNTTNITNDTRPDYYIFRFTIGSTVITQDSRTLDSSNPREPLNASTVTAPSNRIGSPITCRIQAYNSHPNSPTEETYSTEPIEDGIIDAPDGLVLSESTTEPGKLNLTFNRPEGGNDSTITYTWQIYLDNVVLDSGTSTSTNDPLTIVYPTAFGSYITEAGDYKFRVTAAQTGSGGGSSTSGFSNTLTISRPGTFSGTIENLTSTLGIPGTFTISPFAQNASSVNIWDLSWTTATKATNYTTRWTYPDGTDLSTDRGTNTTDYYGIFESGNHTLRVRATNNRYQYVRIDWTAASGAGSYRLVYATTDYPPGIGAPNPAVTVNLDSSTTVYNLESFDNLTFGSISVQSITAYKYANQRGPSRQITNVGVLFGSSGLAETGIRDVSRTQNLTFLVVTAGNMNISGNLEPGTSTTFSFDSNWNPPASDSGWSFARRWGVTRRKTNESINYNKGTGTSPSSITGTDIGEKLALEVTGTYKNVTKSPVVALSDTIVPGPPAFDVTNNFDLTFTISNVSSTGADRYYGTYTGGTIPSTLTSSSFTSPVLSAGQKTIELFARSTITVLGFTELVNGRRSTTSFVTVSELGNFTWNVQSNTATPAQAGAINVQFTSGSVSLDWANATNATNYLSTISGGTQGFRSFTTTASEDTWTVTNGGVAYAGGITSINRNGRALVDWTASTNALSYKVVYTYRGNVSSIDTTSTQANIVVGEVGFNVFVNEVRAYATSNQTGSYKLGTIQIPFSPTITVTEATAAVREWSGTSLSAPSTPTGLTATASIVGGDPRITLTWNRTANATEYGIYWGVLTTTPSNSAADDFVVVQPASGNPSFVHTGRGQGTTYYYWVRARNDIGTSGWSARASDTTGYTLPALPTGITITGLGFSAPAGYRWSLNWNSVFNATLYTYRWQFATTAAGANTTAVQEATSTNAAAKTVSSLNFANRRYCRFRVRAENPAGNSGLSDFTSWTFSG